MKLQGEEFDREYMKAMVEGHEDVHEQLLQQAGWTGTSTRNDTSAPAAVGIAAREETRQGVERAERRTRTRGKAAMGSDPR